MSRIPKYNRHRSYEWYAQMFDLGLMYHPDDAPEDIVGNLFSSDPNERLFTEKECEELRAITELIWEDTHDPCAVAYQVMVDRGEIIEYKEN